MAAESKRPTPLEEVVRCLRRVCAAQEAREQADGELLKRFVSQRDEAAFAALVRRHGPMVYGVCQRVLGNPHDAEDGFQATFLVLARRAASIGTRQPLGNWLYGVAQRVALRVRAKTAARRERERRSPMKAPAEVLDELTWNEIRERNTQINGEKNMCMCIG